MTPRRFDWRLFLILWIASIFGVAAIIPYSITLSGRAAQYIAWEQVLPLQMLSNAILFAIATAVGLFAADRAGLGVPILKGWLVGEKVGDRLKAIILPAVVLGVLASVAIAMLDTFVFAPSVLMPSTGPTIESPPAWQGFLASFYGGINEEILMRLFLFSLLAWPLTLFGRTQQGQPRTWALWLVNIVVAVLFGLGHLPATMALIPLTPMVIARAIVLNGIAGLAFGYLYWTRGLESAMLSHFSADIVLHVLLAL
jgi:membrane protease YdiL (CAAX protease family)